MSPIRSSLLLGAGDAAPTGAQVSRSLRFNAADSAYLSRTNGNTASTYTLALWVKRSSLNTSGGDPQYLFSSGNAGLAFSDANAIYIWNGASAITSPGVYRDISAWYHVVLSVSSGAGTIYVNNQSVASGSTASLSSSSNATNIGRYWNSGTGLYYFSGYLANIHFIDGQALTPASFAETDATTGQWIPKAFSGGSYGTNGFYLKFDDNSSNTASTLGKDTSGNGNNWTPNNFSVVGGPSTVTIPASNAPPTVDYLVVAGGGGGSFGLGGGGGAGGLRSTVTATGGGGSLESPLAVTAGLQYTVNVGAGGSGGTDASVATNGGNSVFASITSIGGGRGGSNFPVAYNGDNGGSGGGAPNNGAGTGTAGTGTANQGFAGGTAVAGSSGNRPTGGGGGAGAVGANGTSGAAGNGGAGVAVAITGSSVTYAGGGGGGSSGAVTAGSGGAGGGGAGIDESGPPATAGTANTGGGGGGSSSSNAGAGGSGIVIIRYANTYGDLTVGGGLTYTYANTGGYKIYSFTASVTPAQAAGNDSLVDSPTNYGTDTGVGGSVRGNYCTWNAVNKSANTTLSNGNLNATSAVADWRAVFGTVGMSSGKWYWELTITGASYHLHGIAKQGANLDAFIGTDANGWGYYGSSGTYNNSNYINTGSFASYTTGDVIGVAFDADNGSLYFYKNGTVQNSGSAAYTGLTSGPYFPAVSHFNSTNSDANFGQRAFAYTAPSGFKALCTQNLPAPLVTKSNTVMDVALYTGNGSTQSITGLAFSPDFVWIKRRDSANNHALFDIVRGSGKFLICNETGGEGTDSNSLISFDTSGFTIGQSVSAPSINNNAATYVGWAWDAGTSTDPNNTQGSITSQVRANATAGFSVATWSGSGSGSVTVGHGLGVAPKMMIVKDRSNARNWLVYHTSLGASSGLVLNSTGAASGADGGWWNNTAPTSTVATIGTYGNESANYVGYFFSSVVGYSSFGSYTGNGSTDGPFVYTGMRPRFLMIKRTDTGGSANYDWMIYDTARDTYNLSTKKLTPNSSVIEGQDSDAAATDKYLDILSNGFKIKVANAGINGSPGTFIYAAFAEMPFNYSRAR